MKTLRDKLKVMISENKNLCAKNDVDASTQKFREGFLAGLEHALFHLKRISETVDNELCLNCYHPTADGIKFCSNQCEFSFFAR